MPSLPLAPISRTLQAQREGDTKAWELLKIRRDRVLDRIIAEEGQYEGSSARQRALRHRR